MDLSFKRIAAYVIDVLLITVISTVIANNSLTNPYYEKYKTNYDKYNQTMEDFNDNIISEEDYTEIMVDVNYSLGKYNLFNGITTIVLLVGYFGIVQYFMDGQTVGKKLLKIKLVHKNDEEKLKIGNVLLRAIILNNIVFRILIIVGVYFLAKQTYYTYSTVINFIESTIESIIFIMVVIRADGRGLHDMLAKTKIINIDTDKDVTEADVELIENNNKKKVVEAEVVDKQKKNNKKTKQQKSSK